jgi:hypothetical protein
MRVVEIAADGPLYARAGHRRSTLSIYHSLDNEVIDISNEMLRCTIKVQQRGATSAASGAKQL